MSFNETFLIFVGIVAVAVLGWRALDLVRYIKRGY